MAFIFVLCRLILSASRVTATSFLSSDRDVDDLLAGGPGSRGRVSHLEVPWAQNVGRDWRDSSADMQSDRIRRKVEMQKVFANLLGGPVVP